MNLKIIVFGLIGILLFTSGIVSARTWYVDDDGGTGINFTKIQDAINAAGDGDTILVYNGIYYENVVVSKQVTLYGENKYTTFIDGDRKGNVVTVTANYVNVSGFNIINSTIHSDGVSLNGARYSKISENVVSNNYYGISLRSSSDNNLIEPEYRQF